MRSIRDADGDVGPRVAEALGTGVCEVRAVAGGDIARAYRVTLTDGSHAFAKTLPDAGTMFPLEASGLRWLAAAGALAVPDVLHVADDLLVLAYVAPGSRGGDRSDAALGRGLALLHRAGAPGFGRVDPDPRLAATGNLATIPLPNAPTRTWAEFYGVRRIVPLVEDCLRVGAFGREPGSLRAATSRLVERLPGLVGPEEPPARLHGDLWGGNVLWDRAGGPWLIDPSAYGGHREVDLAMLQLFGAPGPAFWSAYEEVWPLSDGWDERVSLYQLLPLLVHARLFGGGYAGRAERLLQRWAGR